MNNEPITQPISHKLSYCTVCMNRLNHLKETLPINLYNNQQFKNVQFVVLDYNSTDGLESWMRETLSSYIDTGRLAYYKNPEPELFDRSHSKNMAFKLADFEIVCNVDCDNIILSEYTEYVLEKFSLNNNILITADSGRLYRVADLVGRICCLKKDFLSISGYDELMSGYGFEDDDIIARLVRLGRERVIVEDLNLFKVIKHENSARVKNEKIYNQLHSIYFFNLGDGRVKYILLLNDHKFEYVTFIPSKYKVPGFPGLKYSLEECIRGHWQQMDEVRVGLNDSGGRHRKMTLVDTETFSYRITVGRKTEVFNKILDQVSIDGALLMFMMVQNQERYQLNNQLQAINVNRDGFGKGLVHKNFANDTPIYIH